MRFAGANPAPQVTGLEALPGTANYFIGNDRAKWHTNVPLFARVHYADVYPGIDLSFYGAEGAQAGLNGARGAPHLEYDFVVRSGADPSVIALDWPSSGLSDTPADEPGDLSWYGDAVIALVDALNVELRRVYGQILAHYFRRHGNSPDIAVLSNGHGIAQSANTFDLDRVAVGHRYPAFRSPSEGLTHTRSNRSNGPAYGAGALRSLRCRSKYTSAALNNIIHDE